MTGTPLPPAPEPDGKDWTWVVQRPCTECGLDVGDLPTRDVAPVLRAATAAWLDVLATHPAVTARPAPTTWSPLEYACHVRDVLVLYAERLRLMQTTDDPLYANWDQDATALEQRYDRQQPAAVAGALAAEGEALAAAFDAVTDWSRPGRRSDGAVFTTASFARYLLHDLLHHLYDVGRPARVTPALRVADDAR